MQRRSVKARARRAAGSQREDLTTDRRRGERLVRRACRGEMPHQSKDTLRRARGQAGRQAGRSAYSLSALFALSSPHPQRARQPVIYLQSGSGVSYIIPIDREAGRPLAEGRSVAWRGKVLYIYVGTMLVGLAVCSDRDQSAPTRQFSVNIHHVANRPSSTWPRRH